MRASRLARSRHRLVSAVSTRPVLYFGVRRLLGRLDALCVSSDTEIVIEGYPRSANSTTVYGFLDRQPRPVNVAHHKHHVAQLLRGVRMNIPVVMLVRDPAEASISYLSLIAEARARQDLEPFPLTIGPAEALIAWKCFYRAALPLLDSLVVAPFGEVTQDVAPMIRAINDKFGTSYESGPKSLTPCSDSLGWHARPNSLRQELKCDIRSWFDKEIAGSERLRLLQRECLDIHATILDHHARSR